MLEFYNELKTKNDTECVTIRMILYGTISFRILSDNDCFGAVHDIYWVPQQHPICEFLDTTEWRPLEYIDSEKYGDVVIYSQDAIEYSTSNMIKYFKNF